MRQSVAIIVPRPLTTPPPISPRRSSSILTQQGDFDLQVLVVDGGSTDATLAILRSSSDPRLRWISEPDRGQAAALNKGIAMTKSDIVGWLNADDLYRPNSLAWVVHTFVNDPQEHWLVGRCNIIDENGQESRQNITEYKNRLLNAYTFRSLLRMNMISQPAVFWRRPFGESVGRFDESLHYSMDYDYWLRMAIRSTPLIVNRSLASFRVHSEANRGGGAHAASSARLSSRRLPPYPDRHLEPRRPPHQRRKNRLGLLRECMVGR